MDGVRARSPSPTRVVPPWIAGERGAPTRAELQIGVGQLGAMHVADAPRVDRGGASQLSHGVSGCLGQRALSPSRFSRQSGHCPNRMASPPRRASRSPVREVSTSAARDQLFTGSPALPKASSGLLLVAGPGVIPPASGLRRALPSASTSVGGPRVVVAATQPQARVIVGRGITAKGTGTTKERPGDFQLFGEVDTKNLRLREPSPAVKPDVSLSSALRRTSFGSMLRTEPDLMDSAAGHGPPKGRFSDASTYEGTANCDNASDNVSDGHSHEANGSTDGLLL